MVSYLITKSRDGTTYKTLLALSVGFAIAMTVAVTVMPALLYILKDIKNPKTYGPTSVLGLLLFLTLATFIHHKMNTHVVKFKEDKLGEFKSQISGLLTSKENEVEKVKVELTSHGMKTPHFTSKYKLEFHIKETGEMTPEKLNKMISYNKSWWRSSNRTNISINNIAQVDSIIYGIEKKEQAYKISFYKAPTVGESIDCSSAIRTFDICDVYHISQVTVKYQDGSQNIVKYDNRKKLKDYELNKALAKHINATKRSSAPESTLKVMKCPLLFGDKVLSH